MDIPVWVQRLVQDIVPDISVGGEVIVPEEWLLLFVLLSLGLGIEEAVRKRRSSQDEA